MEGRETPVTRLGSENEEAARATVVSQLGWEAVVGEFARKVGLSTEEITNAVKGLVGGTGEAALTLLLDEDALPTADLRTALVAGAKVPLALVNKHIGILRLAKVKVEEEPEPRGYEADFSVLPQVPDDQSFLKMLQVSGVLRGDKEDAISSVRVAIASMHSLFGVLPRLAAAMDSFADSQSQAVGAEYYKIRDDIAVNKYADVLNAIGVKARYANKKKKIAFLLRLNSMLWPALQGMQQQLRAWSKSYLENLGPQMIAAAFAQRVGGSGAMPPPPPTGAIRDAATGVIDVINRILSGTAVPVSKALAVDVVRIREVLENPNIPVLMGMANREQMLRSLKIEVTAADVRVETALTQYVLGVIELPTRPLDFSEANYVQTLCWLGNTIDWSKVPTGASPRNGNNGNGGRQNLPEVEDDENDDETF